MKKPPDPPGKPPDPPGKPPDPPGGSPEWSSWNPAVPAELDMIIKLQMKRPPPFPEMPPKKKRRAGTPLTDAKPGKVPKSEAPRTTFDEDAVGKQFVVSLEGHKHPVVMTLCGFEEFNGEELAAGWLAKGRPNEPLCMPAKYARPVPDPKKK
jgi:hypothetical protein